MNDDFADIGEIQVTRKPQVKPDPFVCAVCDHTIQDDGWGPRQLWNKSPICGYCASHWGRTMRPSKVTQGDYFALKRLKAITERLNWEIHNGHRATSRLTSW